MRQSTDQKDTNRHNHTALNQQLISLADGTGQHVRYTLSSLQTLTLGIGRYIWLFMDVLWHEIGGLFISGALFYHRNTICLKTVKNLNNNLYEKTTFKGVSIDKILHCCDM